MKSWHHEWLVTLSFLLSNHSSAKCGCCKLSLVQTVSELHRGVLLFHCGECDHYVTPHLQSVLINIINLYIYSDTELYMHD